jgi:hypothetical protein
MIWMKSLSQSEEQLKKSLAKSAPIIRPRPPNGNGGAGMGGWTSRVQIQVATVHLQQLDKRPHQLDMRERYDRDLLWSSTAETIR